MENEWSRTVRRQVIALDFHAESPTTVRAYKQALEDGTHAIVRAAFHQSPCLFRAQELDQENRLVDDGLHLRHFGKSLHRNGRPRNQCPTRDTTHQSRETGTHTHTPQTSFRIGRQVHGKHRERHRRCAGIALRGLSRCRCVDEHPGCETADKQRIGDDSKLRHHDDRAGSPSSQIPDRRDNVGRERKATGGDVSPRVHCHNSVLFTSLCGKTGPSNGSQHQRRA